MTLCAYCGLPPLDGGSLCAHHGPAGGDDWARGNRIMCDFIHRGIVAATTEEGVDIPLDPFDPELAAA
jgi:hypothetical protein